MPTQADKQASPTCGLLLIGEAVVTGWRCASFQEGWGEGRCSTLDTLGGLGEEQVWLFGCLCFSALEAEDDDLITSCNDAVYPLAHKNTGRAIGLPPCRIPQRI